MLLNLFEWGAGTSAVQCKMHDERKEKKGIKEKGCNEEKEKRMKSFRNAAAAAWIGHNWPFINF